MSATLQYKRSFMKVLVIGGVAAGTKAAAKLKREDRSIDVKIITASKEVFLIISVMSLRTGLNWLSTHLRSSLL